MIELLVSVCFIAEPARCKDVALIFAAVPGVELQCQMGMAGQDQIAKWREAHPHWTVKRWTCRRAGKFARA